MVLFKKNGWVQLGMFNSLLMEFCILKSLHGA